MSRPSELFQLFAPVESLRGVGAAFAKQLARLDITRVIDALFHLPEGVIHRPCWQRLDDGLPGQTGTIRLRVDQVQAARRPGQPWRFQCSDAAGDVAEVAYFTGGDYLLRQLPVGSERVISGRMELYGQMRQFVHPDHVVPLGEADTIPLVEPVYGLTEGVSNKRMRTLMQTALARLRDLPEWIDAALLERNGWPGWLAALAACHSGAVDAAPARRRLAYDELFVNQLALNLIRARRRKAPTRSLACTDADLHRLEQALPFALTGAQQRAIAAIRADMDQPAAMLRLLQGDVGSGKTVVALAASWIAAQAGAQAALLAPTELLARQHLATLTRMAEPLGLRIALLTGREKGAARSAILAALAAGEIDLLVGTHALFQSPVAYHDLGLVIVDEQHRFGVQQRLMLTGKADQPPHLLVMTATPIPRTLSLMLYGDMDSSRLDERPPGRLPIETRVLTLDRLEDVYAGLERAVRNGQRAYWVCPLIEESQKVDLAAAEARHADLVARTGLRVGLVHGRIAAAVRDATMAAFMAGEIDVLVATTVIEVGVDVPQATVMIIEQAERFGLAQLHQLRGRVGRGTGQSTCLLLRGAALSETARARLALMRETEDGFRIAEEDLRLRGAGELLGTRQSGLPAFRLADPERDADLIPVARDDARYLLERDERLAGPRGRAALLLLYLFERDAAAELLRSG